MTRLFVDSLVLLNHGTLTTSRFLSNSHADTHETANRLPYSAQKSCDFALVRRIHRQFGRMFGRNFDPKRDRVVWDWHWSHYGFVAPESKQAGYKKPVGHFPFDTRKQESEESYCGFTQLSWHNGYLASQLSTRDLIRVLTPIYRRQGRL